MITEILLIIWFFLCLIPTYFFMEEEEYQKTSLIIWLLSSVIWIIPLFTGVNIQNNEGQYKGYITAIEKNGAFFKGYNAYLKTDLTSSNEDKVCVNRDDKKLIERLKIAQENKELILIEYVGVIQYPIGACPNSDWMIINVK